MLSPPRTAHAWRERRTGVAPNITSLIRNPAYKGEYKWRSKAGVISIDVPPIVSPELWTKAQREKRGRPSLTGWPLIGHITCGTCGASMSGRRREKERKYGLYQTEWYTCNAKAWGRGCGTRSIPRKELEAEVERQVRELLADEERLLEVLSLAAGDEPSISPQVEALEQEDAS